MFFSRRKTIDRNERTQTNSERTDILSEKDYRPFEPVKADHRDRPY